MGISDRPVRAAAAAVLGTGLAALVGGAAVRLAGRRVRARTDAHVDQLLAAVDDVEHLEVTTADGATIHLAARGVGTPVVLLHGVGLQWWVWSALFHLLSGRHRVIAWDMRGHGRSSVGSDGVTVEAVADDLAVVLERLELTDAVVVGHSMGGMGLASFCARHHDVLAARVGALVFVATSASTIERDSLLGAVVGLAAVAGRITAEGTRFHYRWRDTDLSAVLVRGAFGRRVSARAVAEVRTMLAEAPPATVVAAGRSIAGHDVRGDLGHVDVPAAVVVGGQDRLTSRTHARVMADLVDGAELHVLDDVGHQVMQEAPEELAGIIEALARPGGGRRRGSPTADRGGRPDLG